MLLVQELKPPTGRKSREASYSSKELSDYFKIATEQLMEDIRAIERAEQESWAKVRRHEIP